MALIRFHQVLRERVQALYDAEAERILSGYKDFDVYCKQTGYLSALRQVLDLADEIERELT